MHTKLKQATVLIFSIFILMSQCYAANDSIEWRTWSNSNFAAAKKSQRLVLLYAKADWCHWCQNMKATTLQDKNLIKLINEKYIPVKVDVDTDTNLVKKFAISALPTIIILDDKQNIVRRFTGYVSASEMINNLQQ